MNRDIGVDRQGQRDRYKYRDRQRVRDKDTQPNTGNTYIQRYGYEDRGTGTEICREIQEWERETETGMMTER